MKRVKLITDGSCIGNPGPGGWAAILRYGSHKKELTGAASFTTNNRMEMTAVLEGLKALRVPCEVTVEIDSQYVKNGITRWMHAWRHRNWKTITGEAVKNRDLWEELDSAISRHKLHWVWVRGHANHRDNKRCDRLAKKEARRRAKKRTAKSGHR